MWKTFWYMAKLAIVITGSLWLLSLEGDIVFQWDVYKITAHTGFFLFIVAAFVLVVTFVTKLSQQVVHEWQLKLSANSLRAEPEFQPR